jgi:azurin
MNIQIAPTLRFVLSFILMAVLIHCSDSKQTTDDITGMPADESLSDDLTLIDPDAPITEVTLRAQGNTMDDMRYDLSEITVSAGTTVKLILINESTDSSMQHNFVLIRRGFSQEIADEGLKAGPEKNYVSNHPEVLVFTKMLKPGEQTELLFKAPSKAEYQYICTYPGHFSKMNGRFFVE